MEQHFGITQSSADLYVGLHIHRDIAQQRIYINQFVFLRRILARFGFEGCSPVSTQVDTNMKLDYTAEPFEPPYLSSVVVGCLLFAQTLSLLDINFSKSFVAQFLVEPQRPHFHAVDHIFQYIVGIVDLALCFDGSGDMPLLESYIDVDYVGDITNRKS